MTVRSGSTAAKRRDCNGLTGIHMTLGLTVLALTSTSLASTWNAYDHMLYQLQRQGYEETVRSVNGYLPEGQEAQWTFRGLAGDAYAAFAVWRRRLFWAKRRGLRPTRPFGGQRLWHRNSTGYL